jgi:hypothetical protein
LKFEKTVIILLSKSQSKQMLFYCAALGSILGDPVWIKVTLEQVSSVLPTLIIIPPLLYAHHLSPPPHVCNNPEQVTH